MVNGFICEYLEDEQFVGVPVGKFLTGDCKANTMQMYILSYGTRIIDIMNPRSISYLVPITKVTQTLSAVLGNDLGDKPF